MIADLFWDTITSSVVLGTVAGVALAAYIVAHVPLIGRLFPALQPYMLLAAIVQFVAAASLFFLIGFRVADERAETKQLKNDLAFKELQIEKAKETARDAERLKAEADARAQEAKGKLDEFRSKYGDKPEALCAFTPDDLKWLRDLGSTKRR